MKTNSKKDYFLDCFIETLAATIKAKERELDVCGREALANARSIEFEYSVLMSSLVKLVESTPKSAKEFRWAFDGGITVNTAMLLPSALTTAYFALVHAWLNDNGYCYSQLIESMDCDDEDIDHTFIHAERTKRLTTQDATEYAVAVYSYAFRFAKSDNDLRWLLFSERKTGKSKYGGYEYETYSPIKSFSNWLQNIFERKCDFGVFSKLSRFSTEIEHRFTNNILESDCLSIIRSWLFDYCFDGVFNSRHERIVSRVSDRKFVRFIELVSDRNILEVNKLLRSIELISCSGLYKEQRQVLLDSDAWKNWNENPNPLAFNEVSEVEKSMFNLVQKDKNPPLKGIAGTRLYSINSKGPRG